MKVKECQECIFCQGTGYVTGVLDEEYVCQHCHGTGYVYVPVLDDEEEEAE